MTRRRRKSGASVPFPFPPPAASGSPSSSSSSSRLSSTISSRAAAGARPPPGISEFPSAASVAPSTTVASSSAASASATPGVSAGRGGSGASERTSAVQSRGEERAAAVFLPGDPLLPLLLGESEAGGKGEGDASAAVRRLAQLVQQYDAESAAVAAATEAAAAAAETRASSSSCCSSSRTAAAASTVAGFNSCTRPSPCAQVACVFTEKFPVFPYPPAYISCCMHRYEPLEGDVVLGLVNGKIGGEFYTVSVRGRMDALLPQISGFEGATKQHRPRLRSGSVVLCRVERAAAAAAAQLTCVDVNCKKAWHSLEKTFGELQGGCLLDVPPPLAISLMAPHCFVLGALGEQMKFELATASNGRIWVKAHAAGDTVLIANVLLASYGKEPHVIQAIVNALLSRRREKRKR